MRNFTLTGILFLFLFANQVFAQYQPDDPNLDQIPRYLREKASIQSDATQAAVITIGDWDNFSLGVDFGESNMAEDPNQPGHYFTAYNTNATHHTENGIDWAINNPNFGASMQGDPVAAYDSLGTLFYENMYGASIVGCKVITSTTNGATWGTSVTAIAGNDKNWLACDQTSGPYANYVYTTMTNNGVGNFARSMDHGATFASTFAPSTQSLPGMMVCVAANGATQGGAVYVVTNSGNSFSATYTFYRSLDGGATFTNRSSVQWANTVGSQVSGRNSVQNMRTRPYPMITADNSYGNHRGKLYCVYASNDPPGATGYPDIFCRSSADGGATWSAAVKVNDDPNTNTNHQWHPATWCDKETGKLYVMWMDTRDCPTHDSAMIYASYSTDGGATFVANQQISNAKMKINCSTCGGGGTPRYQGDYNGVISNKKVSMIGWTDFRAGNFQSMTAYFPDFAMAIDHSSDTLYSPLDNTTYQVSIPEVKLYTDTVVLSAAINPVPTQGTITFEYPDGDKITSYPGTKPLKVVLTGNVPIGNYMLTIYAKGPNGTPAHKRTSTLKVLQGNAFLATATATPGVLCLGSTSQLNVTATGGTQPFSYAWSPSASLSNPAIQNPVATPTETTTYSVTVTDNTSNTTVSNITVTVNTAPATPGPITGEQAVCAGVTKTYSVLEVVGATNYSWSVPAQGTILSGQNTSAITVQWNATGSGLDLSVLAENSCGHNGTASHLTVDVTTTPGSPLPVAGPDAVCFNSTATFTTGSSDAGVTYNWTVPSDVTINSGQGTDTLMVTWGTMAGAVEVYAMNVCGQSASVSKNVLVKSIPDPAGAITGKDTVCLGHGNLVYSIPAVTSATEYIWTLPEGASIMSGQNTNEVTLVFSNTAISGNLSVKASNDCGAGQESVKAIVVKNCAGIGTNNLSATILVYPNPVSNMLNFSIRGKEENLTISISDATGRQVYSEKLNNIPADYSGKIDMSSFARGVYMLRITDQDRQFVEKIIVQ